MWLTSEPIGLHPPKQFSLLTRQEKIMWRFTLIVTFIHLVLETLASQIPKHIVDAAYLHLITNKCPCNRILNFVNIHICWDISNCLYGFHDTLRYFQLLKLMLKLNDLQVHRVTISATKYQVGERDNSKHN